MENFGKKFDKCPNCSSTNRFCEQLTLEAKEKKRVGLDWRLLMDNRSGAVFDENRAILLPVGSKVPAYHIGTDVCMDCGTIYAIELARKEVMLRTQEIPRGQIPPNLGNPSLS